MPNCQKRILQNMFWNLTKETRNSIWMTRKEKNGERQYKIIERTRKIDQQTPWKKSKIYQKNRRKEKAVEEEKKLIEERRIKRSEKKKIQGKYPEELKDCRSDSKMREKVE